MGRSNSNDFNLPVFLVTLFVLAILFFLFRFIWQGLVWTFNTYVELIKVK